MFEIHVLVDPSQEYKLNNDINHIRETHIDLYNCKVMATVTSTGVSRRQPMISGFFNSGKEHAIKYANSLGTYLTSNGFKVVRIKVENLISFDNNDIDGIVNDEYYESHIKVGSYIPTIERYEVLARLCLKYGIQLLLNPYSLKMAPVTTMRMYNETLENFKTKHTSFINELTDIGFTVYKQHIEQGVYDTNVFTDKDWLFNGDDYKSSITELDCSERLQIPSLE
jgi:hypothetical protein